MSEIREAWIAGAVRTAVGKHGGALEPVRPDDLGRAGIGIEEVGLIELNEAFAAQSLAVIGEWGMDLDDERLNPNGGAIALGHPLGGSGARLVTRLVHEMGRRDEVSLGLATMCVGVGQGIAIALEQPE